MAEGVDRVHEEFSVTNWTIKGMEMLSRDGRELHGHGFSFATANLETDHMYARFYPNEYPLLPREEALESHGLGGKAAPLIEWENKMALNDSVLLYQFSFHVTEERYEAAFEADYDWLLSVGVRTVEHEGMFDNQRGFDRSDDQRPYDHPGFEAALDDYYDRRGGNQDGTVPGIQRCRRSRVRNRRMPGNEVDLQNLFIRCEHCVPIDGRMSDWHVPAN